MEVVKEEPQVKDKGTLIGGNKSFLNKFRMIWMILTSKKIFLVTFRDVVKDKKKQGIKATCKVSGMDYMGAITLTDQFIINEKVVLQGIADMTLASIISIYGSMVRVVCDETLKNGKAYFDRVNFLAFVDKTTYARFKMLSENKDPQQLMDFSARIKIKYA